MHFVITCTDKPGQPELRQTNRADHLDYLSDYTERNVSSPPVRHWAATTPPTAVS